MNKYVIKLKKERRNNENIHSQRNLIQSTKIQPQKGPISERSLQLYKHINELNPYSFKRPQQHIQSKIQNICKLHLGIKHQLLQNAKQKSGERVMDIQINRKISEISSNRKEKNLKQRFMSEIKRIQKEFQSKEQEKQIADFMIKSIKQERKKNKVVRNKFRQKIKSFEEELIVQNETIKQLLSRRDKGHKSVQKSYNGQQLEKQMHMHGSRYSHWLLKIDKHDYYQLAKPNSNKVINLSLITQLAKSQAAKQTRSNFKKSFNYVSNYLVQKKKFASHIKRQSI